MQTKPQRTPFRIGGTSIAITALAVLLTWVLHEAAHWLAGTALGNNMTMTLNSTSPRSGTYLHGGDDLLVSAAGPLFTILKHLSSTFS